MTSKVCLQTPLSRTDRVFLFQERRCLGGLPVSTHTQMAFLGVVRGGLALHPQLCAEVLQLTSDLL